MKDKQIKMYIDDKEVDFTDFTEEVSKLDYVYKVDGKWYFHQKQVEDKKIEKIEKLEIVSSDSGTMYEYIANKINEIIDYINKENK